MDNVDNVIKEPLSVIRYQWQWWRKVCTSHFTVHLLSCCQPPFSPSETSISALKLSLPNAMPSAYFGQSYLGLWSDPQMEPSRGKAGWWDLLLTPLLSSGNCLHCAVGSSLLQDSSWEVILSLYSACHLTGTQNFSPIILQYNLKDCCLSPTSRI